MSAANLEGRAGLKGGIRAFRKKQDHFQNTRQAE